MPELPEVEVVKRSLINKTQNLIVKAVKINDGRLRYKIDRNKIKKIIGLKFKKISRRSKYLLFFFNKDVVMLVHLGMTGKFFFVNRKRTKYKTSFYYDINEDKDKKHDRIIFNLSNNQKLIYNDVRKFGFIKFIQRASLEQNAHLKHLGPEPMSAKFNIGYFKDYTTGKERNIKNILMDQKFISGLGNIYVNEILFLSKVNPFLSTFKLTSDTWETIFSNIRKILKKAIKNNGTTLSDMTYYLPLGDYGNHQNNLLIYGRHICFSCSGKIDKLFIDSRATYMCYKCQK